MKVPLAKPEISEADIAAVVNVLRSTHLSQGPIMHEFEQALAALNALPPRQREVLYLNACEELTATEIAAILEITIDSVKANLSLARQRMREQCHDRVTHG